MLRERLVGTLVLLCAGVILWSVLFDSPAEYKLDRTTQIPVAPHIDPVLDRAPKKPQGIPSADTRLVPEQPVLPVSDLAPEEVVMLQPPAPEKQSAPKESVQAEKKPPVSKPTAKVSKPAAEPKTKPANQPILDDNKLPNGWLIQVGSFGQSANAEKLKSKIQDKGYKAYVDYRKTGDRGLYRVLVGPYLAKDLAEAEQAEINTAFKVKSIVTRFEANP
ncbi:SPOR domain-containing protein [Spongiibacter sp. KMU-158]|uniref:SPOR domain-containing protein n=1 Tax=Spongiibacter pelagi TaxID=2760804 RepID=A0A927GW39_9GAMM|nr:SPOR domain-containing protein [Spongiibacter pelagi]MBD2859055.1 SPOR domain-containing protein [Spongiibacter pelagi]